MPAPIPTGACTPCTPDLGPRNANRWEDENRRVTLGLRFSVDRPGFITGIRHGQDPSTHLARLWRSDGTVLASRRIAGGGGNDWTFPSPVAVSPGQEYVVDISLFGPYVSHHTLHTATLRQSPFIVPPHAGVHAYDEQFPTSTWHDSNYLVSPVFTSS
ncbi:DUF4082 domain-containing protein [Actinosynnema sp. NPDC050436]|uniref:DUF4082 domain-containing protein n=1 Tax=Actinosynnema sp. NPDC050436 TaxID=3155659 RepID=UPI0033DB3F4F